MTGGPRVDHCRFVRADRSGGRALILGVPDSVRDLARFLGPDPHRQSEGPAGRSTSLGGREASLIRRWSDADPAQWHLELGPTLVLDTAQAAVEPVVQQIRELADLAECTRPSPEYQSIRFQSSLPPITASGETGPVDVQIASLWPRPERPYPLVIAQSALAGGRLAQSLIISFQNLTAQGVGIDDVAALLVDAFEEQWGDEESVFWLELALLQREHGYLLAPIQDRALAAFPEYLELRERQPTTLSGDVLRDGNALLHELLRSPL